MNNKGVTRSQAEWDNEIGRVLRKVREHDTRKAAQGQAAPSAPDAAEGVAYENPWGRRVIVESKP